MAMTAINAGMEAYAGLCAVFLEQGGDALNWPSLDLIEASDFYVRSTGKRSDVDRRVIQTQRGVFTI